MTWVEINTPVLNQNQKKEIATSLVESISSALKVPRETVGIVFVPYNPENIFLKGEFLSEKRGEPVYHIAIYCQPIASEQKKTLFRSLTSTILKNLQLSEEAQRRITVNIHEHPLENWSVGGRPVAEQLRMT